MKDKLTEVIFSSWNNALNIIAGATVSGEEVGLYPIMIPIIHEDKATKVIFNTVTINGVPI